MRPSARPIAIQALAVSGDIRPGMPDPVSTPRSFTSSSSMPRPAPMTYSSRVRLPSVTRNAPAASAGARRSARSAPAAAMPAPAYEEADRRIELHRREARHDRFQPLDLEQPADNHGRSQGHEKRAQQQSRSPSQSNPRHDSSRHSIRHRRVRVTARSCISASCPLS
jgi:hypothetical protein